MRRQLTVLACLGVLVFAGAGTALAAGPHYGPRHRPPVARHGYYGRSAYRAPWNTGFRGDYCAPRRRVAAYPAYPVYPQAYVPRSQLGFGLAGRNFSFFYQQ